MFFRRGQIGWKAGTPGYSASHLGYGGLKYRFLLVNGPKECLTRCGASCWSIWRMVPSMRRGLATLSESNSKISEEAAEVRSGHIVNWQGDQEQLLHGPRGNWWYTGVHPKELIQRQNVDNILINTLHSAPQITLNKLTAKNVKEYFDNTWTLTETLFAGLQGEKAFHIPPYHKLRHPMIFYYGHPATFYINKMIVAGFLSEGINPYFEEIFEVGVDEMRWDDMSKNEMDWPSVYDVNDYRRSVYSTIRNIIDENFSNDETTEVDWNNPLWALFMGFEHERIHLETSSVLLRELPLKYLRAPEYWPMDHPSSIRPHLPESTCPQNYLVSVPGNSNVHIGKDLQFPSYGWDNEYGSRRVDVPDFKASAMKVSNGEFLEFVKSGGYHNPDFWSEDGWNFRVFRNAKWPAFWVPTAAAGTHRYKLRTVFNEIEMQLDWPVIVNKHEANAFCKWKAAQNPDFEGTRLLTEAEHMLLRDKAQRHPVQSIHDDPTLAQHGRDFSSSTLNLGLAHGSESPVASYASNESGFYDTHGNVWEWLEDEFNPLNGFKIHPLYDDFSTPCFMGEHNMIMGGSFVSTGDAGANMHCRFHFRPHFAQHAGFRYVKPSRSERWPGEGIAAKLSSTSQNAPQEGTNNSKYEKEDIVNEYLALHYGQVTSAIDLTVRPHSKRPNLALGFPTRCAELLHVIHQQFRGSTISNDTGGLAALDIGCAVGGSSFALSKYFDRVVGIDYSQALIDAAKLVKNTKVVEFSVPIEGTLRRKVNARLEPSFRPATVDFIRTDACNLPHNAIEYLQGPFDAILMANLMCRLADPDMLLSRLPGLLNPGGVVLTTSPFSWMEEFTPRNKWFQQGNEQSEDVLKRKMEGYGLEQVYTTDIPLLIREHERKYQYIVPHAAAFQLKG